MRLPNWLRRVKPTLDKDVWMTPEPTFTKEQVKRIQEKSYQVGYTDGKREGISLSRKLAEQQLRRIVWQQNQNHSATKTPTQRH